MDLPYRTVEIDVSSTTSSSFGKILTNDQQPGSPLTSDGVRIDEWNKPTDVSFLPYLDMIKATTPSTDGDSSHNNSTSEDFVSVQADMSGDEFFEAAEEENDVPSDTSNAAPNHTPNDSPPSPPLPPLPKKRRIYLVCYHLPVHITHDPTTNTYSAKFSESILAKTEHSGISYKSNIDPHWIGTIPPSIASGSGSTEAEKAAIRKVLEPLSCTPVFLEERIMDAAYNGMCKQVLWPAFHNIDLLDLSASGWIPPPEKSETGDATATTNNTSTTTTTNEEDEATGMFNFSKRRFKKSTTPRASNQHHTGTNSDWDQSRLDDWWEAYCQVNETFATILSTRLECGDIMWVHDYHLSLLPKLVDQQEYATFGRSITKKVFFLHIPFPTSQIFRELECGKAILSGMLHADVVGFHAFDYARHFLNASKRILGLNYESLVGGLIGIQFRKKIVLVTMHNVSVEPKMVDAALRLPSVADKAVAIRDQHKERIIIVGVDIAQRLSGISLKLLAYERFLTDYPIWQEKVVMVQKCLLPSTRREDEDKSIKEVRYLVNRIKKRFGALVIDCEEIAGSSLPIVERLALWKTSDVLIVTPIREGLNLVPFEYVFAKKKPASPGVVISSEFSTVCSVMNGVIRVNPYDIQMTVASIDKALTMGAEEKEGRRCRDTGFVQSTPSFEWMGSVLLDLKDATSAINNSSEDNESQENSKDVTSSTAAFLVREKEMAFTHLDMDSVRQAYDKTSNRVIILDLNGTVIGKETAGKYLKGEFFGESGHKPTQQVLQALRVICSDPRNTVFVVSGDSMENVVDAIGDITGLGLAASNGACFAPPLKENETHRQWKYFDLGVNWDAVKKIVLPVFAKYTARSNGSFVKMTHSSIGWSYYSCDPEWGSLQASHLVMELENALRPFNVRFVMIKGIVEIVPQRLNKGLIVKNVLREVSDRGAVSDVDFILCMGDDIQDEKMFTSVFSFIAELEDPTHPTLSPPVIDSGGAPISASVSAYYDEKDVPALQCTKVGNNNPLFAFTVAVGKKESHAFAYVDDAHDVGTLLVKLSGRDVIIADKVMDSTN